MSTTSTTTTSSSSSSSSSSTVSSSSSSSTTTTFLPVETLDHIDLEFNKPVKTTEWDKTKAAL